jgi:UV DNA damage endonuclease
MENTNRYGYCCINIQLNEIDVSANRGMVKRTFMAKGLDYVSEIAIINLENLSKIIEWNHKHGIKLYRITSNLFPWMSEYEITELPRFAKIKSLLEKAGTLAKQYDQRLTFHPGPFNVLASESQSAVAKTVKELNQHSQIFDLMGLECSHYYPVNIHIGGTYGCKADAIARFCENFKKLSDSAKSRLVIENDDRASMYSVKDLYDVSIATGAPVTFDYHHHRLNTGGLSEEDALKLAATTWPVKQLVHYSSCKKTHEDPTAKPQAHADMIYEKIKTYGLSLDIEIEAKAKELAVIKYIDQDKKDTLLNEYIEF